MQKQTTLKSFIRTTPYARNMSEKLPQNKSSTTIDKSNCKQECRNELIQLFGEKLNKQT
jgi:hypothetical protein